MRSRPLQAEVRRHCPCESRCPALESGLQPAYFSGSFHFGDRLPFVRQLEEKDRGEVWPVRLDVVPEIAFRPNLPDASKSTGHRNDGRRKVEHAGCTEELREGLLRFFVDQRRQPQRLDPGKIMIRGCLYPPVDVSDMSRLPRQPSSSLHPANVGAERPA